jgi:hypothetical protein
MSFSSPRRRNLPCTETGGSDATGELTRSINVPILCHVKNAAISIAYEIMPGLSPNQLGCALDDMRPPSTSDVTLRTPIDSSNSQNAKVKLVVVWLWRAYIVSR